MRTPWQQPPLHSEARGSPRRGKRKMAAGKKKPTAIYYPCKFREKANKCIKPYSWL
jgi:hypothetical protein